MGLRSPARPRHRLRRRPNIAPPVRCGACSTISSPFTMRSPPRPSISRRAHRVMPIRSIGSSSTSADGLVQLPSNVTSAAAPRNVPTPSSSIRLAFSTWCSAVVGSSSCGMPTQHSSSAQVSPLVSAKCARTSRVISSFASVTTSTRPFDSAANSLQFVVPRVVGAARRCSPCPPSAFEQLLGAEERLVAEVVVAERHQRPERARLLGRPDGPLPAEHPADQGELAGPAAAACRRRTGTACRPAPGTGSPPASPGSVTPASASMAITSVPVVRQIAAR